ncbi:MAG: presenilin family intramembrane aspartyl protease [Candidatus Nanoarchaeia archaeon]
MAIDFKPQLLMYESLMFLVVQGIALATGASLVSSGQVIVPPPEGGFTRLGQFLIAFLIAFVLIILILKLLKTPLTFNIFFAFLIFVGAQVVFNAFLPLIVSILLAIAVVAIRWRKPNLITHNIAIFLGVAGVSALLGTALRPWPEIIILLIALSIYDFIAVFKTKIMVSLFKELLKRGAPLAIIVPEHPTQFITSVKKVSRQKLKETDKKVLMLGTGDLAFPALFAVSALTDGVAPALAVVVGSIVGLVFNHYLMMVKKFRFIPALPFIALFSIISYVIAVLPRIF